MSAHLKVELDTFNQALPSLLGAEDGKFALVVGDKVVGTYESYADAVQDGYKEVGLDKPFLVKKITVVDDSAYFTRPLAMPKVRETCHR